MDDIEEDDIEEDYFEEDSNFCSGKIPFNIQGPGNRGGRGARAPPKIEVL